MGVQMYIDVMNYTVGPITIVCSPSVACSIYIQKVGPLGHTAHSNNSLLTIVVGVLRHKKYLKAALHSTNVSIGTIVV